MREQQEVEAKKTESSDDEIKRLIKERRTIARKDKQQLKEVSKRSRSASGTKQQQKEKRRYSRSLRSSVESRTYLRSNPQ